jgi:signal peptidase I
MTMQDGIRNKDRKKTLKEHSEEFCKSWLPVILCFLFLRGTVAEARYIPTASMEPSLLIHDRILVEKLSYKILGRPIQRGDILVFYPPKIETGMSDPELPFLRLVPFFPEKPPAFIKRVVGLPGDRIEVKKGIGIFVNGNKIIEAGGIPIPRYDLEQLGDIEGYSMTGEPIQPFGQNHASVIVPVNHLFMMGDNHNQSADSHVWGFLDENRIVGRVFLRVPIGEWLKRFSNAS